MKTIYIDWNGIVNRKGELLAIEESPEIAPSVALNFEIDAKRPTNRIVPITILVGVELSDLVVEIVDLAKIGILERKAAEAAIRSRLAAEALAKRKKDTELGESGA